MRTNPELDALIEQAEGSLRVTIVYPDGDSQLGFLEKSLEGEDRYRFTCVEFFRDDLTLDREGPRTVLVYEFNSPDGKNHAFLLGGKSEEERPVAHRPEHPGGIEDVHEFRAFVQRLMDHFYRGESKLTEHQIFLEIMAALGPECSICRGYHGRWKTHYSE